MEWTKKWIEKSKTAAKKRILIVEDDLVNREVLGNILSPVYEVLGAEDDERGLAFLKEQKAGFSLILLNIVISVMDGYIFLSRVKADTELALIPVMATARGSSEADEVTALSYSAADFMSEPYWPEIVLYRVASIINLGETVTMVNELQYDRLTGLSSKEYFYRCVRDQPDASPGKMYDTICSNIENLYWQAVFF